jgi:hypothetical protein
MKHRITQWWRQALRYFTKRARFDRHQHPRYWDADSNSRWQHPMGDPSCEACGGRGLLYRNYAIKKLDTEERLLSGGEVIPCLDCWLPEDQKRICGPAGSRD